MKTILIAVLGVSVAIGTMNLAFGGEQDPAGQEQSQVKKKGRQGKGKRGKKGGKGKRGKKGNGGRTTPASPQL